MPLIKPIRTHQQLLEQIDSTKGIDDQSFRMWWLGQSGFLVQFQGEHLLFDPYLSDSLTEKYATTDKPHVRMTELAVDPATLDFVDVVTSSHNHTDHLDAETIRPVFSSNSRTKLVVSRANVEFAAKRLGIEPESDRFVPLSTSENATVGSFMFYPTPAAHPDVSTNQDGDFECMGLIVKFGKWTLYHSGDTMFFDGMAETLSQYDIDLAILPINGNLPERRVAGNLWGDEAARLANRINASMVVPCHYEMFEFNTESPELFGQTCREINQPYTVMQCGGMLESSQLD